MSRRDRHLVKKKRGEKKKRAYTQTQTGKKIREEREYRRRHRDTDGQTARGQLSEEEASRWISSYYAHGTTSRFHLPLRVGVRIFGSVLFLVFRSDSSSRFLLFGASSLLVGLAAAAQIIHQRRSSARGGPRFLLDPGRQLYTSTDMQSHHCNEP